MIPPKTDLELDAIVSKLAPYLQRGLSIRKACQEAKIHHATVYRRMQDTEWFRDKIEAAQNFFLVTYSDARLRQFLVIYKKLTKEPPEPLTKTEVATLNWLGENFIPLRELYGKQLQVTSNGLPFPIAILSDKDSFEAYIELCKTIANKAQELEAPQETKQLEEKNE